MSTAFENVLEHLDQHQVRYRQFPDEEVASFEIRTKTGVFPMTVRVDDDLLQVYGQVPLAVPEGARGLIAEAVARANFGMRVGNFELDVNDGELRFHASVVLQLDRVEDTLAERLITITLAMLERYIPAFMSIIYGNEPPAAAIALVESDM
jgi:hypothetical protein